MSYSMAMGPQAGKVRIEVGAVTDDICFSSVLKSWHRSKLF